MSEIASDRLEAEIVVYTDGACSGNPGPGGWGAILISGNHRKELSGGEPPTTNNRMELMAAISALEALKKPSRRGAAHQLDLPARRHHANGYTAGAQRLEDRRQEAGQERRAVAAAAGGASASHEVDWRWVKGHSEHVENDRADELAREGMKPYKRGASPA